jgi:hypothetical protein
MFYCSVAKSFVELTRYLFTMPSVKVFLSQRICQDAFEKFFGYQRQRGATHDNPKCTGVPSKNSGIKGAIARAVYALQ